MEEDTLKHFSSLPQGGKSLLVARSGRILERVALVPEIEVANASLHDLPPAHAPTTPTLLSDHLPTHVVTKLQTAETISDVASPDTSHTAKEIPAITETGLDKGETLVMTQQEPDQSESDVSRLIQQRLNHLNHENIRLRAELEILRVREKELMEECNGFRRRLSETSLGTSHTSLPSWRSQDLSGLSRSLSRTEVHPEVTGKETTSLREAQVQKLQELYNKSRKHLERERKANEGLRKALMECQTATVIDSLRAEVKMLKDELASSRRENTTLKVQQTQHEKALEVLKQAQEQSRADDYGEQLVRLKLQLADLEERRRKRV